MRIKMLDSESTRVEGRKAFHYLAGHEYDLPEKTARAWIDKRIAEKVRPKPKQEKKGD